MLGNYNGQLLVVFGSTKKKPNNVTVGPRLTNFLDQRIEKFNPLYSDIFSNTDNYIRTELSIIK